MQLISNHPQTCCRPMVLILATIILTCGCGFDPSVHTHSVTRPDDVFKDGVVWIPLKLDGDNDEWFWIPWQAAAAAERAPWNSDSIDVLVKGKVWRVTADGSSRSFTGPRDPPDVPISDFEFVLCLSCGVLGIIGLCGLLSGVGDHHRRVDAEASLVAANDELDKQRRALAADRASFEADRQKIEAACATERRLLEGERSAYEDKVRTLKVAARRQSVSRKTPSREEWLAAGDLVRAQAFSGQAVGRGVVVNYFLDPLCSGRITFRWEITLDRPIPPRLTVLRNGRRTIREESGPISGEFGDQIRPNKRYRYQFKLFDGSRQYPDPALIELTLPPFKGVEPAVEDPHARRQRKEAWRKEQYDQIDHHGLDANDVQIAKAAIDEEAARQFGED